jgi:glycosyltransferase involved in cell wall biosynthesis
VRASVSAPRFSVIVPVRNDQRVDGLLASLAAQQAAPPFEVLVALDGATRSPQVPKGLATRLLEGPPAGPYAARNRAVREARGEVVAFTDSDCLCPSDWLRLAAARFEDPATLALQGASSPATASRLSGWIQREYERYVASHGALGFRRFCNTRNFAIRREIVLAAPLPEKFPRGGDAVYGLALDRAGVPIRYDAGWVILHRHPLSRWREARAAFDQGRYGALWRDEGYDLFGQREPGSARGPGARLLEALPSSRLAKATAATGILAAASLMGAASAVLPGELGYRAFSGLRRAAHLAGRLVGESEPRSQS